MEALGADAMMGSGPAEAIQNIRLSRHALSAENATLKTDLKTNAALLAHQTDLAREAEIGKVRAEAERDKEWVLALYEALPWHLPCAVADAERNPRAVATVLAGEILRQSELQPHVDKVKRLREAAWPVADQVAEVVVMGADGSRCRLVPVGLLLALREALAAKDVVGVKQPPAGEPTETLLARIDTLKAEVKELREILSAWVGRCAEEPLPRRRMTVTPEQGKNVRDLLERLAEVMDESADFYHGKPVSEFSDALRLLFKQMDDDKGLLLRALRHCDPNASVSFKEHESLLPALRARLGEVPAQGEEADDGEAKA
ncbi:unnamed protein product [marine sediment metagenome]|uniref:Uncharacterized protein n=1 Tax=marine sediment metagenome TaxID=412755 RepID=X1FQA3_9ZZZZ